MYYTEEQLRTILRSATAFFVTTYLIYGMAVLDFLLFLSYDTYIQSRLLPVAVPLIFLLDVYVEKRIKDSYLMEEIEYLKDKYGDDDEDM